MKMNSFAGRGNADGRFFPKVNDDPKSSLFPDNFSSSSANVDKTDCKTINKKEKDGGGNIDNTSWDRHDTTTTFSPNQSNTSWEPAFFPDKKYCEENENQNQNKKENTNKETCNSATFSLNQSNTSWDPSLDLHDENEEEVEAEIFQFVNLLEKSQSSERMKALLLNIIRSNKCEELKTSLLCTNSKSLSEFDLNRSEIHEHDNSCHVIDDIDIDIDIDIDDDDSDTDTDTDTDTNNDKNKKQSDHRTIINDRADRTETNTPKQPGRRNGLTTQRSERRSNRRSSSTDITTANRRSSLGRQRRSTRNLKSETSISTTHGHKSCSELDIDENSNKDNNDDGNNPRLSSSTKNRRSDLNRRSSYTDVTNPTKNRRSSLSRQRRSSESEPFYVGDDDDGNSNNNNNPRISSSTKSRRSSLSRQRYSSQSVRNLKSETSLNNSGHKSCGEINIDDDINNDDDDDDNDDNNNNSSSSHQVSTRERTDGLHDLLDNMRLATTLAGPSSVKIEEPSSVIKEEELSVETNNKEKKGLRNLLVRHLSKKIVTSSNKGSYVLEDNNSNSSDEDDCWEVAVKS
jgi:hypothetical protein